MKKRILSLSTVMTCGWLLANTISNVTFSPPSPASLDWGEDVVITFNYQTDEADGVRFSCYPLSSDNYSLDAGTSGSALYAQGSGSAEQSFTLLSGNDRVDSVILRMLDDEGYEILHETTLNVDYAFPRQQGGDGPYPHCDQTRILAHLTRFGSPFTSTIIIENMGETVQSYQFTPYGQDGAQYYGVSGQIPGYSTAYLDPTTLFSSTIISHFEISADSRVVVSVSYEGTGQSTPVYVPEGCEQAKSWRLFPSNWGEVFDGIAVVNMGSGSTDLVLRQISDDGTELQKNTVATNLAAKAKALYVLDTDFSQIPESHFVLEASQPVVIVALAGTRPGAPVSFLWTQSAFPMD